MDEIFVVYELAEPEPVVTFGSSVLGEPGVRTVHAVPADPAALSSPGLRTLCDMDASEMRAADEWRPSEHPGGSWFTPRYADRVCHSCHATVGAS